MPAEVPYAGEQTAGTAQLNLRLPPALKGRGELTIRPAVESKAANP
ncbi:MAG TPA: hypothetical protein PLD20_07870 [Blastocatellia bacterium]|nr:hypothetical protein [Blastocatellia bacterium]HMV81734.1 hypothetical protein [Blastocatellia bacterium]HMX25585.1 hypothetical protein [Blastocatellia bacterium]HMY76091.1 hypothetical protein [Blastocatellia bacterium]HMZ17830.1 hypothetical protein [Blastocatellia bacterium]